MKILNIKLSTSFYALALLFFSGVSLAQTTIPIETTSNALVLQVDKQNDVSIIYYGKKLAKTTEYDLASQAYNQVLSEKRAASVKAALVAQGIDATKIVTAGFGETKNAVPTKDSVPEALNRRVEIEVAY